MVRPAAKSLAKGHKHVFELYTIDGEIKACKLANGQLVKGHHGSYLISAASEEEMESWIGAIRNNVSFNPLYEMIKKKMMDQEKKANESGKNVDFKV
jgi:hypothetical protein